MLPPTTVHHHRAAEVYPDFGGIGGSSDLASIVGALLTIVLIVAVLTLVTCGVTWALSSNHGNYGAAGKARTGVLFAVATAAFAGAGVAWMNFLIGIGAQL